MNSTLTLRNGDLLCDIKPELGGSIAGLWLGADPVLSSVPGDQMQTVRQSASYPLVPFSNRIGHGQLQWAGTSHPLIKNFEPEPHTIHGVGWQRPWAVLESTEQFALLSFEHKADASWPFDFDCSQAFKLEAGALEMTLSITNQSPVAAPVGLGWHPYFPKRSGTEVQFSATGRWEMGSDKLPTHRVAHPGLHQTLELLTVDHCFDGWGGVLTLRDSVMRVRVSSALSHLVVYTNPQRDNIAVEPVSHVNNALNLMAQTGTAGGDLGVVVLQPGQTYSCEMRIDVERAL
ncbi:aldose 1-epimerase [Rhodoferax saidenbachensis]|uniref:Aldose 1-epimerase n=1 Tax=Rhodoferax saidenbachensis TaxID=1484693 RepID=A0ABU1ZPZ8_9BURK|nr:aldose 1-epimerase [Rhodoferax saidenbachensis]MDR7306955.1 aldose 1-epimerase [Rhodoferax saidenbachensis]